MKNIQNLITRIELKYKNSPKKKNKELDILKRYIRDSDLFRGKKRSVYKMIKRKKSK